MPLQAWQSLEACCNYCLEIHFLEHKAFSLNSETVIINWMICTIMFMHHVDAILSINLLLLSAFLLHVQAYFKSGVSEKYYN